MLMVFLWAQEFERAVGAVNVPGVIRAMPESMSSSPDQ